ncbi:gamma-butyrobetaine hydroxylase, putative [Chondromyces apiculatus DSM 436]|uniref:Gamma-butyrobetaine hydroxylase, putative n=1 Tax=Chondromyces apiculatus DSM 436 TaxID=1192034 RepID=A0A017T3D7_9BACT|nr:gamma-butyrobetaine hydroxylase, putative [Chondromyces apiculatus DSM 436]
MACDGWLEVHFGAGTPARADFHWFWLRHQCDGDRHPLTGERTLDASEVPLDIRPLSVTLDDAGARVLIAWDEPSGRRSAYDLAWLRAHAYAPDRPSTPTPPSDVARVTLDLRDPRVTSHDPRVTSHDPRQPDPASVVGASLDLLRRDGLAVVKGFASAPGRAPVDDTDVLIDAFAAAGLSLIVTHFGRIEDLRTDNTTNQNTDQLGYTDAGIDLHTDQPFLDHPPRYQLLQCIRPATVGGESFLVDALAAARLLQALDAPAFELLTTVPMRFHRKQKSFERVVDAPLLTMAGPDGFQTRYSYFTLAPFHRPFAEMEAWYRAYSRFARIVRDQRHQYRFQLEPGDFVIYDNYRMLHARTSFSGPRWLRGVYFDPAPRAA